MSSPDYTEYQTGKFAINVFPVNGSTIVGVSGAGTPIAAVVGRRFNITYIDISAENNSGISDGSVSINATIGGVGVVISSAIVPIGTMTFAVSKSLVTNILCDTNTAVTISISGTIVFLISIGGFYI